ncbi:MAG: ABC transporter permease, partial [Bacteroidota bacterium]|nr:ABC transporter permease [Bacteroidota bacterium]
MRKTINILASSFRLTMQELMVNKLRTALSLTGISFGIFCIIGVLATVNSLEVNVQNQIKSLGTNTIYIDKWNYVGGPDYPWWKYINRPVPKFSEVAFIKERSQLATNVAFFIRTQGNVQYDNFALQGVDLYGVSEEENDIQPVTVEYGRYISGNEFQSGSPVVVMGYDNAENLFGSPSLAVGKEIKIKDKSATVVGVLKKVGQGITGWNYDACVMCSYRFARQIFNEDNSNPAIMVKGKENVSEGAIADELEGVMRSIRKL